MITVTYDQVLAFRRNQENYTRGHNKEFSKFLFALSKVYNKTKDIQMDYNDRQQEINLDHCEKKDGFAVMEKFTVERMGQKEEQERFKFKIEDQKKLQKAQRDLLNQTVEVESFLVKDILTDIPNDLDFSWWSVFAPFVLPTVDELEGTPEGQLVLEELYRRTAEKQPNKMKVS